MQFRIKPGGPWHRREVGNGGTHTACNEIIVVHQSREDRNDDLCAVCYTRHEMDTGKMAKLVIELEKEADPDLFYDPDEEPTDPNGDADEVADPPPSSRK